MKIALPTILMCFVVTITMWAQSGDRTAASKQDAVVSFQEDVNAKKWDYFLYPVPAVDEINVKITRGHVTIHQINVTDEFGNQLLELTNLTGDKVKVDISELPEGKYFMQIIPDDKLSVKMKRFYVAN